MRKFGVKKKDVEYIDFLDEVTEESWKTGEDFISIEVAFSKPLVAEKVDENWDSKHMELAEPLSWYSNVLVYWILDFRTGKECPKRQCFCVVGC
ncbi:MAG: hypothetical protein E7071_05400 [Bacteroidales bacterium]|nr:hypothetical protein [Bacteroidales bacterium]